MVTRGSAHGSAVVVGAGLAGTVAAARLATLGVKVTVVADRPGATAMHGGGWYLGLGRLKEFHIPTPRIGEALEFVSDGLVELALEDGPFALTDVEGVRRVVDVAPRTHARAVRLARPLAVADLAPLGHPFAEMQPGGTVVAVNYPRWPGAFGRSFAAVAARVEASEDEQTALVEALKSTLAGADFGSLLLPPILGLGCAEPLRDRLEEALDLPVAETLDTQPSTPGLRLDAALRAWLGRLHVELRRGRVTGVDLDQGVVRTGEQAVAADAVVLATGGVIPGGLSSDLEIREPLCGLRVAPELPVNLLRAIHPERPYGGALFRAGVAVDERFRPIHYDGRPVHARLFAAGDLLAGPDRVAHGCGSGVAVFSGYLAANALAEALAVGEPDPTRETA